MKIIWVILTIFGAITAFWYFKYTLFNPYGKADIPKLTRKPWGHLISWIVILIGIISFILLIS